MQIFLWVWLMLFFSWSKQLVWKHPRYLNVASVGSFVSNYVVPNDVAGLGTTSDVISEDDWLLLRRHLNTVGFETQEVEWSTTRILLSTTEIREERLFTPGLKDRKTVYFMLYKLSFDNAGFSVRSQVSKCGIFGEQSDAGTRFYCRNVTFTCQHHSTSAAYSV